MPLLQFNGSKVPVEITRRKDEIELKFGYNEIIKDEVKVMEGARWKPENKSWTIRNSQRNQFALDFLCGVDVYGRWDVPLLDVRCVREQAMNHQHLMLSHCATRGYCILAAEMGTGKTLVSIEYLEWLNQQYGAMNVWFVAPRVALLSVTMEFYKWRSKIQPLFMTPHELTKRVTNWESGQIPPQCVIVDEASKYRNPAAKSSQALFHLAGGIRDHWGDKGSLIEMSGSPAPKSPLDWFQLTEIARPGFLREGTRNKLMQRIAIVKTMEADTGVTYPKILGYRDSVDKCHICGKLSADDIHTLNQTQARQTYNASIPLDEQIHKFIKGVDEVSKMYKRMEGLVLVVRKDDCMDLPEKVYTEVKLEVSPYMKKMAKMVHKSSGSAANSLIRQRELSDGFLYTEVEDGQDSCTICAITLDANCKHCGGKGYHKKYKTVTEECDTPKEQALKDWLELKEDDGRLIVFAGFQGSIDRVTSIALKAGWSIIRRDGRGWYSDFENDPQKMIRTFQRELEGPEKILCIGHPASMGMGITLTASDTIIYWSNDFNAESRIQSEDRIHRPGCRGANIVDFIHLPVDKLVLDNLKKKRDLQSLTLGEVERAFED